MKKHVVKLLAASLLVLTVAACGSNSDQGSGSPAASGTEGAEGKQVFIGQSFPTYNNPWYVQFAKGSKDMAAALDAKLVQVTNPETSAWAPEAQIPQIENLIAQKPDVLLIDPTSTDGINTAIEEAARQNIPVVVDGIHVSTKVNASVTADNKQGAALAGEYLGELLEGKGKIAILLGTPGRDIVQARESGFKEAIGKFPDIQIVGEQIADMERAKAITVTENILQANPDIDAIWAANDEMALGALEAVRAKGLVGKVKIGGFDATPDAVSAINKDEMQFTANQIPYEIGARAVAAAYMTAQGKPLPSDDIVLPMNLISTDNVKDFLANEEQNQKNLIETVIQEYGLK